jgi:integrase
LGRSPLYVGTFGNFTYRQLPSGTWRARARFRDDDGVRRDVYGHGPSKAKAAADLRLKCRDRSSAAATDISPATTVSALLTAWLAEIDGRANLAASTKEVYRQVADRHIVPALGQLRVRELSAGRCDRFIQAVSRTTGPGLAKTARTVLSGVCGVAVRHGALPTNPLRDIATINHAKRSRPRTLTRQDLLDLIQALRADPTACEHDLPDLVHFMVGTGARIGEAMAVRRTDVDFEAGTVTISATVQRLKGRGLILQEHPKSDSSVRTLYLSADVVMMLERRIADTTTAMYQGQELLFPSPLRRLRDRSNTTARLREALDRAGPKYRGFSSHAFRKAVMTLLDESGVSARQAADQAGHAKVSMTQDVYFGRGRALPQAAIILAMPELLPRSESGS